MISLICGSNNNNNNNKKTTEYTKREADSQIQRKLMVTGEEGKEGGTA